ncbi:MAG: hypothetical protein IJJ26_07790 [Victivallales bacterium]|nr:hypothetical protein [Victivallales bacterium]
MTHLQFQPVLAWHWIVLWLLFAFALCIRDCLRSHRVSIRYRVLLLCLEGTSLLLLTAILAQPAIQQATPAKGNYRILLLADHSASMATRDANASRTRLELLEHTIANRSPELSQFLANGRTETFAFTDERRYLGNGPDTLHSLTIQPGLSAPGTAIDACLRESSTALSLGAILLLSDGRTNAGPSPTEVAKQAKALGIPISCVGFGTPEAPWDISVRFEDTPAQTERDHPLTLRATVHSTLPSSRTLPVELLENGIVIASKTVSLDKQEQVDFSVTPRTEGHHGYTVRVPHLPEDSRADTDVDYAVVHVLPPPQPLVLLVAGGLDWELPFLRQFLRKDKQFRLASIVMTGKNRFHRQNLPEDNQTFDQPGFHLTPRLLEECSAVILDTRAAPFLQETDIAALRTFVENKGGGLLARGPIDFLPDALREMLPVRITRPLASKRALPLEFRTAILFDQDTVDALAGHARLPAGHVLALEQAKRAASAALLLPEAADSVLLSGLAFGAGRTAYLGWEESWQWRLAGNAENHLVFWRAIFTWLTETEKPRLRILTPVRASLGEELALDITITGNDFQPASNARATAVITAPDSNSTTLTLEPQWNEDGRYTATFTPTTTGEHRIHYQITVDEPTADSTQTRTFEGNGAFVTRQSGPETEDTTANLPLLQDIARITNGAFFTPETFLQASELPVSQNIPTTTQLRPLASPWLALSALTTLLASLWYARRRIGLK